MQQRVRGEEERGYVQHMHKLGNAVRQFECGPPSGFTCGLAVNAVGWVRASVHVAYYRHRQTLSAPRLTHTQKKRETEIRAQAAICRHMHKTCLGTVAAN